MIDPLEPRRLFHSTFLAADGSLLLEGTAENDHFELSQTSTKVKIQSFDNGVAEEPNLFDRKKVKQILIYGEDGNDTITIGNITEPVAVDAGKGNDSISGGQGRDTLKGGPGRDTLLGNDGDDLIDGGTGNDSLDGGSGQDILDYRDRKTSVQASLGTTNNGEISANEHDFASTSFESIRGGHGNDTLTTTGSRNVTLLGGDGNDTLIGGGGNDAILGGPGRDSMVGNGGVDQFYAQDGAIDTLDGGAGDDKIHDQDKNDVVHGIIG